MSSTKLLAALVFAAALSLASPALGQTLDQKCKGLTVTADQTIQVPLDTYGKIHSPTGWLHVATAGSGTPRVQVNAVGPLVTTEDRRVFVSCGVLTANTGSVECPVSARRLDLIVTGCSGACDLEVAGCGSEK